MYNSVISQRYGKAKGMKVKHLVQLVALTVLFTWFLYQLNSSHKAKVLSRRAQKEDEVDDELLITSDGSGFGQGAGDGVGHDEDGEVAHEELIDTKSVGKSRKELRPFDVPELEQTIAEGDRVDDVFLDDSGEGAGDEKVNSEESVRRAEATEIETTGKREGAVVYHESVETMENAGDGEDEGVASAVKEFDAPEERTQANPTEEVEADFAADTKEKRTEEVEADFDADTKEDRTEEVEEVEADFVGDTKEERTEKVEADFVADSREERTEEEVEKKSETLANKTAADDIPDKTERAGSESSEQIKTLKTGEVEKNFTKQDEVGTKDLQVTNETETESATQNLSEEVDSDKSLRSNQTITSSSLSPEPSIEIETNSTKLKQVEGLDKESNVSRKLFPRSQHESSQETLAGPIPSIQNGADSETEDPHVKLPPGAKAGQRSGVGDILRTDSSVDDKTVTAAEDGK